MSATAGVRVLVLEDDKALSEILCDEIDAKVERAIALDGAGQKIGLSMRWWNFFGQQAVFLLRR